MFYSNYYMSYSSIYLFKKYYYHKLTLVSFQTMAFIIGPAPVHKVKHPDATLKTSSKIFNNLFSLESKMDCVNSLNKNNAVSSINTYLFLR